MIKWILFFSALLFVCSSAYSQPHRKGDSKEKIEALEKIKLLEVLDMDEETAIKFFTRRNDHKQKIKDLFDELDKQLNTIENKISEVKEDNDPEFKKLVDNYYLTHQKLDEERKRFINSLTDILTYKQLAKLILFERRFREEIRDVLFFRKNKKLRD